MSKRSLYLYQDTSLDEIMWLNSEIDLNQTTYTTQMLKTLFIEKDISKNLLGLTSKKTDFDLSNGQFDPPTDINYTIGTDEYNISNFCIAFKIDFDTISESLTTPIPTWCSTMRILLVGPGNAGAPGQAAIPTYHQVDNVHEYYQVSENRQIHAVGGDHQRQYTGPFYLNQSDRGPYHQTVQLGNNAADNNNSDVPAYYNNSNQQNNFTENLQAYNKNVLGNTATTINVTFDMQLNETDVGNYGKVARVITNVQHAHSIDYTSATANPGADGGGGAYVFIPEMFVQAGIINSIQVRNDNVKFSYEQYQVNAKAGTSTAIGQGSIVPSIDGSVIANTAYLTNKQNDLARYSNTLKYGTGGLGGPGINANTGQTNNVPTVNPTGGYCRVYFLT
jgi:hypothetical protein